jgi:hypothetical protein
MLIYAAVDSLAWASVSGNTSRKVFTEWVNKYLLPSPKLGCTADELYSARCTLLHNRALTNTDSRTRGILYAWSGKTAANLQSLVDDNGVKNVVAVHVESLLDEVSRAFCDFLKYLETDPEQSRLARIKSAQMLPTSGRANRMTREYERLGY